MSKDIWHTADITPEPCRILICKTNKGQNYTAIIPSPQEWNTIILPEFYNLGDIDNAERIEQYAYLDDLLALETELDRTREELYKANAELDYIKEQVKKSNAFIHARIKVAADQIARGIIDQVKIIKEKKDVK
ncbi:MAG: hypothetical protein J6W29_03425 [Neisseriaceae bacterium]|nr:hypothetical protein [Neisseriaceae bacterium]